MGDSSDDEFPESWVLYSKRPEWQDVVPLEQDDGPNPVVAIQYGEIFSDVYGYFRAVLASQEKSQRALDLTKDALRLNAANYTVWQYRRDILRHLQVDLTTELSYTEDIMVENPKNYQVWHHRRVIVEWLNDASLELELTEDILNMDAKNYHAWQHRQWAIKEFNMFDNELMYVDKLIAADVRNNSAWNQRIFVLKYTGLSPETLQVELRYVMNRIQIVKENESSWNFLRGILKLAGVKTVDQYPEVLEFCEELYQAGVRSPYLLSFLVDIYEEMCLKPNGEHDLQTLAQKVSLLCQELAKEHDTIREKYWKYVEDRFLINFERSKLKDETCSTKSFDPHAHESSEPLL